jgi:hypothetical protein
MTRGVEEICGAIKELAIEIRKSLKISCMG